MSKKARLIAGIIAILVGAGIIVAAVLVGNNAGDKSENDNSNNNNDNTSQQAPSEPSCPIKEVDGAQTVLYGGIVDETAFDTLKRICGVESNSSDFGEFVTAIEGKAAGTTHFWAFYVNDKMAEVGASTYKAKEGDEIKWVLTKLDANY